MLKTVLKHCLFHLKDGTSQRGSTIRLSLEHQNLSFLCVHSSTIIHYIISIESTKVVEFNLRFCLMLQKRVLTE